PTRACAITSMNSPATAKCTSTARVERAPRTPVLCSSAQVSIPPTSPADSAPGSARACPWSTIHQVESQVSASPQRIIITPPLKGDPFSLFGREGFPNVWMNPIDERLARPALLKAVAGAHAILATPADTNVNAELFDAAGPQLIIVSNYAVGVDNVDL